jgi:hypothetical protein
VRFSTDTGDAWLLDPAGQLAARLARIDRETGRASTIFGYPIQRLAKLASEISNMFG